MKILTKVALVAAIATLVACGGKTSENNAADLNATTDMNAGMTDMNTTDMNATTEMNAAGNSELNAAHGNMAGNAMGNATTNY